MPRVYTRKFDWDEAKALRERGMPVRVIAARLGVSKGAVYLALNADLRAYNLEYARRWRRAACSVCGGPAQKMNFRGKAPRCVRCAALARVTTVRADKLHCATCGKWKPDEAFPRNAAKTNAVRRGRHYQCRLCLTEAKRRYRERNRQPCSHGCGTLVDTVDRRDKTKPLECVQCANRRIHAERTAKAAA